MNCLVSVIIPVYNCERYLERAIESVVNQDNFAACELILIDDGSTDNSPFICDSYVAKYDNIKVIHQNNSGVSVARNSGIEISEGEWIYFLDSDDYLLPDCLDLTDNYNNTDLICTQHNSNEDIPKGYSDYLEYGTFDFKEIESCLIKSLATKQFFYTCWAKFFKRSLIIDNNVVFPKGRKLAEDMVFVFTYLTFCDRITVSEKTTYYYNVNNSNTTNVVDDSFDTFKFIYMWKTEYFKKHNWYNDDVEKILRESFLWKSFFAIKSAANYKSFAESVAYLKKVFNDPVFYDLYYYNNFETLTDRILDWSIRHRNPIPFCLIIKLNVFKSKIAKSLLR